MNRRTVVLETLAETLLNLHRGREQLSDADFRPWALAQVQPVLGFARAFWGTGAYVDGELLLHTRGGYELPPEIDEVWEQYKHLDETVPLILQSGGQMALIPRDTFRRMAIHDKVWGRFGIRHGMGTAVLDPATGLLELLCFLYSDDNPQVADAQRRIAQCLTPHLIEAWRVHRLGQLSLYRQVAVPHVRALVDREGVLHSAEPELAARLAAEWPEWSGGRLPQPLVERLGVARRFTFTGARMVVEVVPSAYPDLFALFIRPLHEMDRLTEREREVARLFASGLSHKEVAGRLGLSPATVRVHLGAVYQKTGISNKAALAGLLASYDFT